MDRIVRFSVVGAINTCVYYGLYRLLYPISPYLVAHVLAFMGAMVGSYFLNCNFVFQVSPALRTFLLFPLSNVTNFCVQTVGLYLFVDVVGMNQRYAPLPSAAAAIPVTFVVAQVILAGRANPDTRQEREHGRPTPAATLAERPSAPWFPHGRNEEV